MKEPVFQMQKEVYTKSPKEANGICSHCGVERERFNTFEMVIGGGFKNESNGDYSAIRRTPLRATTMMSDVFVPAAQSVITAVVFVAPTVVVSLWYRWSWYAPIAVGSVAILLAWIRALDEAKKALFKTEEFSYYGSEQQVGVESGARAGEPVRLEVVHETSGIRERMQLMELPGDISEKDFGTFLADSLAGKGMTRKNWTGVEKPFSRDQFDSVMEKLEVAEMVCRLGNNKRVLTDAGKRAIKVMVRRSII